MLHSEGATPIAVADGLDDMIRQMQQIPGSWARPDSWSLVQNSYLQLVETLEQALRSWFEDDDGAVAGLYSEHYRLIREMTASTPRPSPLLNDEAARQVRALERLRTNAAEQHVWRRSARCPGGDRAHGGERVRVCAGHRPSTQSIQDCRSARIYVFEQRPQQDSNLRTRLRRGLLCMALACGNMLEVILSGRVSGAARLSGAARA